MIEQFIPQEFCLRCKGCCCFKEQESLWQPHLTDHDIEILMRHNFPPALISSDKRLMAVSGNEAMPFVCSVLGIDDHKCKAYQVRPFECQLYPFLLTSRNGGIFLAVDPHCAFVDAPGNAHIIEKAQKDVCRLFHRMAGKAFLIRNQHLFFDYPDVRICCRLDAE